jgi:hypothetical protein
MFLNSMHGACPPGTILRTEDDWINFSSSVLFAAGTDMEKEKKYFLTSCKNLRSDPSPFIYDDGTVYVTLGPDKPDETGGYRRKTTGGINPALILAAVATYFFVG